MLETAQSLWACLVMLVSAYGLGRPLVRRLAIYEGEPLDCLVWSEALGLWLVALLLLLLAAVGWLNVAVLALVTTAGLLWGMVEITWLLFVGRAASEHEDPDEGTASWRDVPPAELFVRVLAISAAMLTLLAALAPPTSPEVLSRSLVAPKNILLTGSLRAIDGGPIVVNLPQMLWLWGLALDGPVAASLLHWCMGAIAAAAASLVARTLLGAKAGWLAASLVVLSPGVLRQMSAPLDDLALAMYAALAFAAFQRARLDQEHERSPLAAGLALAAAMAVGPAGLMFAAAMAVVWSWDLRRAHEWSREQAQAARRLWPLAAASALPWLLLNPAQASLPASQSSAAVAVHVGPLLLGALAGLALARRLRGLDHLLATLGVYLFGVTILPGVGRSWAPLVPLAAAAAVWTWQEVARLQASTAKLARAALMLLVLIGLAGASADGRLISAAALGWRNRDDFLLARVPTYRAASLVNQLAHEGQKVFCQDPRTFYFACAAAANDASCTGGGSPPNASDERLLAVWARERGFAYLLLVEEVGSAAAARESPGGGSDISPLKPSLPDEFAASGQVIPILEYRFADNHSRPIRYSLLKVR